MGAISFFMTYYNQKFNDSTLIVTLKYNAIYTRLLLKKLHDTSDSHTSYIDINLKVHSFCRWGKILMSACLFLCGVVSMFLHVIWLHILCWNLLRSCSCGSISIPFTQVIIENRPSVYFWVSNQN